MFLSQWKVILMQLENQNEILNDQVLEATLKYDVEKYVLSCSDFVNDNSLDEIENVKREFLETQGEIDELIVHVNQKTYAYANVRAQKQDLLITISELKARLPSSRSSSSKNSVLSNTKNHSEEVEVHVRTNKKTNIASKKNVVQNKKIVTNVDVKNAPKANDVFCVSCDNNVLTPCHDKCLAKYKLNVHSNVRRALFTTPRTAKSKSLDTTTVIAKTRISISDMAASSSICLMSKATSTISWL
nr:hypothetical protein [Tanacetum cinerariifolium]